MTNWDEILEKIKACRKCELCKNRIQAVPYGGDRKATIAFVGESPGRFEDEQGIPFVGKAGKVLDRAMKAADINRDEVFICNTLCCRPERNAKPTDIEINNCREYVRSMLDLVRPRIIVHLGDISSMAFHETRWRELNCHKFVSSKLGKITTTPIGGMNIPCITTYHPSYIARMESHKPSDKLIKAKKQVLSDLKRVVKIVNSPRAFRISYDVEAADEYTARENLPDTVKKSLVNVAEIVPGYPIKF